MSNKALRRNRPFTRAANIPPPNMQKSQHKEAQRKHDARRGTAAQRGYGGRWQRYRETYLRQHPLCRTCESAGLVVPAKVVDHIVPARVQPERFFDPRNHQPLCVTCHNAKTAQERDGVKGCDLNGRPLDPEHPWNQDG